jgi:hypothetical protein
MSQSIDAADLASMYCDRQMHPRSGRVYASSDNPPLIPGLDDGTFERLVRLSDDRLHSVLLKMLQYQLTEHRVLKLYKQRELVQNFTGARSDAVYANVRACLRSQLPHLAANAQARAPNRKQVDSCNNWAYYSSDSDDEYYDSSARTARRATADEQPLEQPLQQQPFQERQSQEQFKTEEVWSEPGSDFWANQKSSVPDGWTSRPRK